MAKATGTIDFSSVPANSSTIVINDGQSVGHSQVTFRMAGTAGGGGEGSLALDSDGFAKVLDVYNSHTTSKGFMRIAFHIDTGGGSGGGSNADFKDMATGGSTPLIYEFTDPAGNIVNITLVNEASGFTSDVSGASYARKDSAGNYSINTNNAGVNHDNIAEELKDILVAADTAGEIVLGAISRQNTYWLQISSNAAGDAPFSFRIKRASGSWANTASPAATITKSTSSTGASNIRAQLSAPDEPVYSQRNAETGGSGTLSASEFATYFGKMINGLPMQITATVSGTEVSLQNDNHGTDGNVTITTSGTTNTSITGMSGGSAEGGETVARTKINSSQLKISSTGGLAATGSVGELALDISGSMELVTSAQNSDLVAIHDGSAGRIKKISVANLISAGVAGSDTQVQYNNGGSLGGAADLVFNDSTGDVTIGASTGDAKLLFRDSNSYIFSEAANDLKVVATDFVVDAATLIDLQSDAVHFGENGDTDVVLTFNANTSDGQLKWMEDEDYFEFSDDILMASGEKIQFGDTGEHISGDGTDLTVVSSGKVSIDATNALDLNSAAGDIKFQDGGVDQLALDLDGTAGAVVMKLMVDSDDFVFQQYDGTEVFRVEDDGAFDIAGGAGSSGVTVSAAGQLTADGRIIVDDATEATSTTDGSIQTDGGLSVAKSVVIGDDLDLLSNSAILKVGSDQPFTLTHSNANNTLMATSGHRLAFGDAGEYISGDGTDLLLVSSADVKVTGDLVPSADDTHDLGTADLAWQDIHLEGDILAQDAMTVSTAAGNLTIDSIAGTATVDGHTGVTLQSSNSGNILLDSVADIVLDADDADIVFKDGGTEVGSVNMASSNLTIKSAVSDKDIIFMGNDGGSSITALTLDMSNAGRATFNENVVVAGDLTVQGTTTTVDSTTINISSSFTFEGPADAHETTLHAGGDGTGDAPAADTTIYLPALSSAGNYFLPVMADKATAASAAVTAAEFALLDGGSTVGTTALSSGDGFLHNDGGTMKQTSVDKIADLFAGDGLAASSGVMALSIAGLSSELSSATVADTDEFAISDGGTMKKIDFQHVRDSVFADVSADVTIAAGGVATIAADAVHGSMLNDDVISSQTEVISDGLAAEDELMLSDGGTLKKIGVDTIFKDGPGLLDAEVLAVANDHIMFLDGGATGDAKTASIVSLVAGATGNGLQASSGQISVDVVRDTYLYAGLGSGGTVATLTQTPVESDSVLVFLNGMLQTVSGSTGAGSDLYDYTISGTTVTMRQAIDSDDILVAQYIKQ